MRRRRRCRARPRRDEREALLCIARRVRAASSSCDSHAVVEADLKSAPNQQLAGVPADAIAVQYLRIGKKKSPTASRDVVTLACATAARERPVTAASTGTSSM